MRLIPCVVAIAFVVGCAPRDRDARLARVAAEGRSLEANLDRLEERLLATQARVRLWRELRERHESVSGIACASQEEHAEGMALHALPSGTHSSLHQARVAAAAPGQAKPSVRMTAQH